MNIVIELKEGMSELPFGSSPEKVKAVFGEPEEIEEIESLTDGAIESIVWFYEELGLNFFFDVSQGTPTLCTIESDNRKSLMFGNKIFELNKEDFIGLMQKEGYSDPEIEKETWGEMRITFDALQADFYFSDNELTMVSWSKY